MNQVTIAFHDHYFLEENNSNYIYIFYNLPVCFQDFLIFLFPTPWNFPSLEINFFIFQILKVFQGAWEPCYRFPPANCKNQTKTEKISIITPKKCVIGIDYVRPLCNRY